MLFVKNAAARDEITKWRGRHASISRPQTQHAKLEAASRWCTPIKQRPHNQRTTLLQTSVPRIAEKWDGRAFSSFNIFAEFCCAGNHSKAAEYYSARSLVIE